jgi:Flp pilus assembly protein TadD
LVIKPDFVDAHNNLGAALARHGQVDEAVAHFTKALEFNPSDAGSYYNLGNVFAGRGQVSEAVAHYQKALDLASARSDKALADRIRARIRSLQSVAPAAAP